MHRGTVGGVVGASYFAHESSCSDHPDCLQFFVPRQDFLSDSLQVPVLGGRLPGRGLVLGLRKLWTVWTGCCGFSFRPSLFQTSRKDEPSHNHPGFSTLLTLYCREAFEQTVNLSSWCLNTQTEGGHIYVILYLIRFN